MGMVRCPVVVGRDREIALGVGAVAASRVTGGAALAVVGEAGIGKTRLVAEWVRAARLRGLAVISGRGSTENIAVPLAPWAEALSSCTRGRPWPDDALLTPYRAVLGLLIPAWRGQRWVAPSEPPGVLDEAIVRVLAHLAGTDGLLVVLDDMHWADPASVQTVGYVIDHIGELPVVLCLAMRPESAGVVVAAMARRAGCIEVDLQRLDPTDVTEMVARCAMGGSGTDIDHVQVDGVVAASEGLPLVVEDLLASVASVGSPSRFADIVRSRMGALPLLHRRAVRASALLGERVDWPVVTGALSLDDAVGDELLADIVGVDLMVNDGGEVRFRHALTRAVVVGDVLPAERAGLAGVLAESCLARRRPSLARDLQVADLFVVADDHDRAIRVLTESAGRAEDAGELADAEVAAARAYALTVERRTSNQLPIGIDLVRLRLRVGRPLEAIDLGGSLLAAAEGRDRQATVALHLMLARAQVDCADWDQAAIHLDAVRASGGNDQVVAELAVLDGACAFGADRPGQRVAVEFQAAKAAAMAHAAGLDRVECEAYVLAGRAARQHDLATAAASLERALAVAETAGLGVERLVVLDELGTVEMLRDARSDRLERAYDEALRAGAFGAATSAGLNLASAYAMTGRHRLAAEQAEEVQARAARLGFRGLEAACELMRGIAAAFDNDRAVAEVHLGRAEQLSPDDPDLRVGVWAIGHGVGALVDDDRPRARRAFERAQSFAPERHARILDASVGPRLLLDALDGTARAEQISAVWAADVKGARWSAMWLGAASAVALARNGSGAQAVTTLHRALDAGERYPLFGALARRLVADAALAEGFTDPVPLLRDAEAVFTDLGLVRPAESVRGRLRSLGAAAPRRRGESLITDDLARVGVTAREAEVLDLLADRRTNREIAAALFVSPKTVEKHVAALAMKLGVANRQVLAEIARSRRARSTSG